MLADEYQDLTIVNEEIEAPEAFKKRKSMGKA
jgi:hypothetical protein